jgi:hypothetical protein
LLRQGNALSGDVKREMKRGRLLDVSYVTRGIGKTELLVSIARKTGALIVVPNLRWVTYFRHKYPDVNFVSVQGVTPIELRYYRCGILLEEGISKDDLKMLMRNCKENILGGYCGSDKTLTYYVKDGQVNFTMSGRRANI